MSGGSKTWVLYDKSLPYIEEQIQRLADILSEIPLNVWDEIVRKEPEWIYMEEFYKKLGFGKFAVLLLMLGLNDYQTKGKAEVGYWPPLKNHLEKATLTFYQPQDMIEVLKEFFENERLSKAKIDRLKRFLNSKLAREIWNSTPAQISGNLQEIWDRLAKTMNQRKDKKTIVFAMKCLGIALMIAGFKNFNYNVPIPVDSRVQELTKKFWADKKSLSNDEVINFWQEVLQRIRKSLNINMIHLDSLIWQIATLSKKEIIDYFKSLEVEEVGKRLAELI